MLVFTVSGVARQREIYFNVHYDPAFDNECRPRPAPLYSNKKAHTSNIQDICRERWLSHNKLLFKKPKPQIPYPQGQLRNLSLWYTRARLYPTTFLLLALALDLTRLAAGRFRWCSGIQLWSRVLDPEAAAREGDTASEPESTSASASAARDLRADLPRGVFGRLAWGKSASIQVLYTKYRIPPNAAERKM